MSQPAPTGNTNIIVASILLAESLKATANFPYEPASHLKNVNKNSALPIAEPSPPNAGKQARNRDFFLFLRNAIKNPRSVGALIPASQALSAKMAALCDSLQPSALIELGPGTGVITERIRHLDPRLVEIDEKFSERLRGKFPGLQIFNECAVEFLEKLDYPAGVICSIPLINNPAAKKIKAAIARQRSAGLLEWVAIYSYGKTNPLADCGFENEQLVAKIPINFPPARIWLNS
jgi:phosphatidylethanolamine/phosphatidyl-N-methylethanolamine N-methyltransferase